MEDKPAKSVDDTVLGLKKSSHSNPLALFYVSVTTSFSKPQRESAERETDRQRRNKRARNRKRRKEFQRKSCIDKSLIGLLPIPVVKKRFIRSVDCLRTLRHCQSNSINSASVDFQRLTEANDIKRGKSVALTVTEDRLAIVGRLFLTVDLFSLVSHQTDDIHQKTVVTRDHRALLLTAN